MSLPRVFLVFAFTALGLSCGNGGEDGNNDDGGDPAADAGTIVETLAEAQCAKLFECCSTEERGEVFGALEVENEEGCREALRTQAEAFFRPALEDSLEKERVTLQSAALDECVNTIEARSCSDFEAAANVDVLSTDGCGEVVASQLALSAFCSEDYECRTGFCSRPSGSQEGSCKNPPGAGEDCLNDRCGEDLYCTPDELCAEKLGAGEVCTRNTDCESDSCQPGDEGDFVCAELPDLCSG